MYDYKVPLYVHVRIFFTLNHPFWFFPKFILKGVKVEMFKNHILPAFHVFKCHFSFSCCWILFFLRGCPLASFHQKVGGWPTANHKRNTDSLYSYERGLLWKLSPKITEKPSLLLDIIIIRMPILFKLSQIAILIFFKILRLGSPLATKLRLWGCPALPDTMFNSPLKR